MKVISLENGFRVAFAFGRCVQHFRMNIYVREMWVGACGSGYLLTVRFTKLVASLSYTRIKRKNEKEKIATRVEIRNTLRCVVVDPWILWRKRSIRWLFREILNSPRTLLHGRNKITVNQIDHTPTDSRGKSWKKMSAMGCRLGFRFLSSASPTSPPPPPPRPNLLLVIFHSEYRRMK